jgi:hypothetical protein
MARAEWVGDGERNKRGEEGRDILAEPRKCQDGGCETGQRKGRRFL